MERENQELNPRIGLEQELLNVRTGQMIQFTPNGFRLYEYVETGETQTRTARSSDTEHVFEVPVRQRILRKDVDSLAELFYSEKDLETVEAEKVVSQEVHRVVDTIDTEEFKTWLGSLANAEDVKAAAAVELKRRQTTSEADTLPCGHCKGSGGAQHTCASCDGCGKIAKYPHIILKNELTGERRILKLDLAELIVSKEVEVLWHGFERHYPDLDYQLASRTFYFNVADYIDRNIADMGIEKENAVRIHNDSVSEIDSVHSNVYGRFTHWTKSNGEITIRLTDNIENMSAGDVIERAQRNLSGIHSWPVGKMKNNEGVAVAEEWIIRPMRPIEDALADLKTAVAGYGLTLGLTRAFIATGETGPAFYLLDNDGNALGELSTEYGLRESLENAWLTFQKMKESL